MDRGLVVHPGGAQPFDQLGRAAFGDPPGGGAVEGERHQGVRIVELADHRRHPLVADRAGRGDHAVPGDHLVVPARQRPEQHRVDDADGAHQHHHRRQGGLTHALRGPAVAHRGELDLVDLGGGRRRQPAAQRGVVSLHGGGVSLAGVIGVAAGLLPAQPASHRDPPRALPGCRRRRAAQRWRRLPVRRCSRKHGRRDAVPPWDWSGQDALRSSSSRCFSLSRSGTSWVEWRDPHSLHWTCPPSGRPSES